MDDAAVVAWKSKNQAEAEARVAALMRGETPAEVSDIADADDVDLERKRRRNAAIEFHNRAMQLVPSDKHTAYRLICSSVTVDPTFGAGLYMMGNVAADLEKMTAAVASYRRALQLPDDDLPGGMNPDLRAKCMLNLSHRLTNLGENEEALSVGMETIAMLEANPDLDVEGRAFAYTNMAQILMVFSREDEALEYALKGWEMSQIPIVELGLAFALLFKGDFARGLKHFESRFGYRLQSYLEYPYDRWDGKLDHGKTLFVVSEQGLGDTISFARFLGMAGARCKKVIFQVHPELHRLMTDSLKHFGNVEVVPMQPQYPMADFPVADAWCSVMSVPVAMGLTTEEIACKGQGWTPKHEKRVAEWKYPGEGLHVGIAWAGSAANGIDKWRSVPFSMFLELARVSGVHLYSLQVGDRVKDLHEECAAALVRDLSPYIRDVSDTCSILDELDLVITVESFLGHLCGAMGKECWLLASKRGGDWRLGRSREKSLWYDDHVLYRQGDDAEWAPVFRRVVEELQWRAKTSN